MSPQQRAEDATGDDGLQQNNLGHLPVHHPLIKDGLSDEGLSSWPKELQPPHHTSGLDSSVPSASGARSCPPQRFFRASVWSQTWRRFYWVTSAAPLFPFSSDFALTNQILVRSGPPDAWSLTVSRSGSLPCAAESPHEPSQVEEGGLEGEGWAKPLAQLWQNRPPSLKKEREYNRRMCSKPPYCSVCMLFHTYQQVICRHGGLQRPLTSPRLASPCRIRLCQTECVRNVEYPVLDAEGGMRTKPLIPEMCFTTTTEEDSECEEQPATAHLEEDGTSLLISCSQCCVRVHASQCATRSARLAALMYLPDSVCMCLLTVSMSLLCSGCYGVDPASVTKEWKCARCKANAMAEVSDAPCWRAGWTFLPTAAGCIVTVWNVGVLCRRRSHRCL